MAKAKRVTKASGYADAVVLVGVLKQKRDLALLLSEQWYRMPLSHAPVQRFDYLAFYQPAAFGKRAKQIEYYAAVAKRQILRRAQLLPREVSHPKAREPYVRVYVSAVIKLARPIINQAPRRVVFGFTTLGKLLTARNMLQLYDIVPTEDLMKQALVSAGIQAQPQHWVSMAGKRYRLDFAIQCKRGKIAIECDNTKAHSSAAQLEKDREKNTNLKRHGWTMIRLAEKSILADLPGCMVRIRRAICQCGGLIR